MESFCVMSLQGLCLEGLLNLWQLSFGKQANMCTCGADVIHVICKNYSILICNTQLSRHQLPILLKNCFVCPFFR